jgi:hypothetical protein
MSPTKTIRIIQTVHVSHTDTIERSWYDVVERTLQRIIDTDGRTIEEHVVEEQVIEEALDMHEKLLSSDEDTEPDEIVEEVFEEDED